MKSHSIWYSLIIVSALILITASGCSLASAESASNSAASSVSAGESLNAAVASAPQKVLASVSEEAASVASQDALANAPQDAELAAMPEAADAMPANQVIFEPPVPGQGGTCIEGSIIDIYHRAAVDANTTWTVTITPEEGTPRTTLADANGRFRFDQLTAGMWTVELEMVEGWQLATPISFPVTLSGSGANCAAVRFKLERFACLDAYKLDLRGNPGSWQKVGIPGWTMTAAQGATVRTELTNGQGKATFTNLNPGTWTVTEETRVGWAPASGSPPQRTIQIVSPHGPDQCQAVTFVNHQIFDACIRVNKVDVAGNPLSGWQMTIIRNDGTQPSRSQYTDRAGSTTFCGLALGDWTVQETVKDWWRPVGPASQAVSLTEPGQIATLTFRNEPLGCVDGYKINHLNEGLPGWTIRAHNDATDENFSYVTDKNGYFVFPRLTLTGTWTISEVLQDGWVAITPTDFQVDLTAFKCERVRFKNRTEFACLDVYKQDATDHSGLPGWTITLQPAFGGTPTSGVTDGTGHVRFNGLTPGIYKVSETMQDGWYAVTPQSQQLTLQASGRCEVVTFKNRQGVDPPPVYPGGCRTHYWVRWGDTLFSISRRYGTTVDALKRANGLYSNLIYSGQKLCIP